MENDLIRNNITGIPWGTQICVPYGIVENNKPHNPTKRTL